MRRWAKFWHWRANYRHLDEAVSELDERAIHLVDSNSDISELEVTVSTEAELQQALLDLDKIHVGSDATYTIWVDSSSAIVFANQIDFRHPDGDRIRIEAAAATAPVTLSFPSSSGLILEDGQVLGYFGGFNLVGSDLDDGTSGVAVRYGSQADLSSVNISSFDEDCLQVAESRNVIAEGLTVSNCDRGVNVSMGSVLKAASGISTSNHEDGWVANLGSVLYAYGATTSGNGEYQYRSLVGSTLYLNAAAGLANIDFEGTFTSSLSTGSYIYE